MLFIKFTRLAVNRDKPVNLECCLMLRTYINNMMLVMRFQTLYLGLKIKIMLFIEFTRLAVNRDKPVNLECCRMLWTYINNMPLVMGFQTLYLGLENQNVAVYKIYQTCCQ